MTVANTTKAIVIFHRIPNFVTAIIVINATATFCQGLTSCPAICQCFYVFPNELDNPPTYTPLSCNQDKRYALLAVSCQRQQLTLIPNGIPTITVVLFLAYNQLDHLEANMFEGLEDIQTLDISHNKITRIANDTFNGMKKLEYLNIAYNNLNRLPSGFLCPWYHYSNTENADEFVCEDGVGKSVIGLNMIQNPWHCDCAMQEFIENFSCKSGRSPCIEFLKELDDIGQCHAPARLEGTPVSRLSSKGAEGSRNLCRNRSHIDIPMVITMVTWFGGIIGYVIYFIRWNHKEIARQSSYLASLDKKQPLPISVTRTEIQESENTGQGSHSETRYVQTTGQNQDRYHKLRFGGDYAVSRQSDSHQECSSVRQKRRPCVSSPSSPQNKIKQEEIYRMSSL